MEPLFKNYDVPPSGKQTFRDSSLIYKDKKVFLNIKAKSIEKLKRSRTNLSSLDRFIKHYQKKPLIPYIIVTFIYEAVISKNEFIIKIQDLQVFNLLEIPKENLKIEGAYEGSYRIYISPIPDFVKNGIYQGRSSITPEEFIQVLKNLKINYLEKKGKKKKIKASVTKIKI